MFELLIKNKKQTVVRNIVYTSVLVPLTARITNTW